MYKTRCGIFTFYYEVNDDGEKVLKKIRFHGMPKQEYTIEGDVIVEDDSVDSSKIKDESIEMDDLSQDVKDKMDGEPATDDDIDDIFTEE